MSLSNFGFLANDNLPSRDHIVAMCREAGECRGIPLPNQPGERIVAWVKYGPGVTTDEALTQDWVAKTLNARLDVMEYTDAPDCTRKDVKLVAHAVQMLISVRGPSSAPGHVGGGPIVHTFFADDRTSPFRYETVDELEQHVNGILNVEHDTRRVNLVTDAIDGLCLCPCDINPGNFKKRPDGKVVVLDLRATCFLPPSFFAVAMKKAEDIFTQKVAQRVDYPKSDNVAALVSASYYLVPYRRNGIGAPRGLRQSRAL